MARNEAHIDAPPSAVWAVLADGYSYADWVVGAKRIRATDPGWPEPGKKIHHTVGVGPLAVSDRTRSLVAEPERVLLLDARAVPLGRARVRMELEPDGDGTRVTMVENPSGFTSALSKLPPMQFAIRLRNVESLRRLGRLAEERHRREHGLRAGGVPAG